MNMQVNAKQYTSAAQIFVEAKARQERMERAAAMTRRVEALEKALMGYKQDNASLKLKAGNLQCAVDRLTDELKAANNIIERLKAMTEAGALITPVPRRRPFQIAQEYLEAHHPRVKLADVISDTRLGHVDEARHGVFRAVKNERDDMSVSAIARRFKRDPSTVLLSLRKTEPKK